MEEELEAPGALQVPEEPQEQDQPEAPKFSAGTSEEVHSENRGRLNCSAAVTRASPWSAEAYS